MPDVPSTDMTKYFFSQTVSSDSSSLISDDVRCLNVRRSVNKSVVTDDTRYLFLPWA